MNQYYSINIPKNIKIVVWKNENNYKIMLLSDYKIIKLFFSKNSIKIDKWSNSIVVYKNNENITAELIKKKMDNFLKSLSVYFFTKIKFKGKGFRIKFFKKIKLIKFFFGRSHKTFVMLKGLLKKKISKYKFLLFYIKKSKILSSSKLIVNIKPINFYTLRGLRLNRQIIYKRKGKKGTYI